MEDILREGLNALGLTVSEEQLKDFRSYYTILEARSKVMNLTAIHGEADTARLHFLDSAALLTLAPLHGKRVIDVGTGAGFPGLPFADPGALDGADPAGQSRQAGAFSAACLRGA